MSVIYGSEIASDVKAELKLKMDALREQGKRLPKLVVILVGNNPASISYVTGKEKACIAIGMDNELLRLDENITQEELHEIIERLNYDDGVDGILVQLPLPKHLDEQLILESIDPTKDVDGFHPYNVGKMMLQQKTFLPCTPKGIMVMLSKMGYDDLSGMHAVVMGRSHIVGKPMAQLLLNKNASVTTVHSRTNNIKEICKMADILIVAIGKAKLVDASYVKKDAIVIDVGINRNEAGKLCGDVDFDDVKDIAKFITPVPKGVGPMTIAMLLDNTYEAYMAKLGE